MSEDEMARDCEGFKKKAKERETRTGTAETDDRQ